MSLSVGLFGAVYGIDTYIAAGVPCWFGFGVAGGTAPYTVSATGLPAGLALNTTAESYGAGGGGASYLIFPVEGAPAATGTYNPTFTVVDHLGATQSLNWNTAWSGNMVVLADQGAAYPQAIMSIPPAVEGSPYSFTFDNAFSIGTFSGTPPFTYSVGSGQGFPPPCNGFVSGIGLSSSGTLSGTPNHGLFYEGIGSTEADKAPFYFTITDAHATVFNDAFVYFHIYSLPLPPTTPRPNVYSLQEAKLTDDDYGQISPYYVTYFAPTFDQEQQLELGGGRKLLAYLSMHIAGSRYLAGGCRLNLNFYGDTLRNQWALSHNRTLKPLAPFDGECAGGSTQSQRIAVKFASVPLAGQTDNAFQLTKVVLWVKVAKLPVRGSIR